MGAKAAIARLDLEVKIPSSEPHRQGHLVPYQGDRLRLVDRDI